MGGMHGSQGAKAVLGGMHGSKQQAWWLEQDGENWKSTRLETSKSTWSDKQ